MKKGFSVLVAILGIGLLTGCSESSKSLTCSYTYDSTDDSSYDISYILKFDKNGDTLKSYQQKFTYVYPSSTEEDEISEDLESAKESCDTYTDMSGTKCSVSQSNNSITLQLDVDMSKLDDEGKEALSTDEVEDFSYDEFKTYMEDSSFTCK